MDPKRQWPTLTKHRQALSNRLSTPPLGRSIFAPFLESAKKSPKNTSKGTILNISCQTLPKSDPEGPPKETQNLSKIDTGRPKSPQGRPRHPKWTKKLPQPPQAPKYHQNPPQIEPTFEGKCKMQATRLPQKRVIQPKGASGSKSLHRKNTLSAPWQMNFRNPSKSPQHPKLTKTSRCGSDF